MRRQVRPFVTEVRASGRRSKDGATRPERDTSRESDQPRGSFGGSHHEGNDDSYEAALKAADALFSGQRTTPSQPGPTAHAMPDRASASAPVDHAVSVRNGTHARLTADADAVFAPPSGYAAAPQNGREAPENGGRILRAIEAPSADPFAALEAERAPKRRGRKPGSKNKPKWPVMALASETGIADTAFRPSRLPKAQRLDAGARTAALVALLSEPATPGPIAAPARRAPALVPAVGKTRDRFAWVRTKLRPGEKWKRRLPKIAW